MGDWLWVFLGSILVVGMVALASMDRSGIPGPPGWPIIGNKRDFDKFFKENPQHAGNTLPLFLAWAHKYGPVFKFSTLGKTNVFVNDPELIKHLLRTGFDKGCYDKGPGTQAQFQVLLGHGIFNTSGESWKMQRKKAMRIFHNSNLKQYVGRFEKHALSLR